VINLFVGQGLGAELPSPSLKMVQGFNVLRWSDQGMNMLAVSDLAPDELEEFRVKFDAAAKAVKAG
jgi:hypothetical protein